MDEDKIDKLLENINLLIERNNIINQQVTRILFLCLNNQYVDDIKNNRWEKLININKILSGNISHIMEISTAYFRMLSNDISGVYHNLMNIGEKLSNNINTVNNTFMDDIDELMNKLLWSDGRN